MSIPPLAEPIAADPSHGPLTVVPGHITDMSKIHNRLRRLEGQIRGIDRMIIDDRYCLDIFTQISAVNKALSAVALGLLEEHLRHCIRDAAAAGLPVDDLKIAEVTAAVSQLVRS